MRFKRTLTAKFSGMSVAAIGFLAAAPFADHPLICSSVGMFFLGLDFDVKRIKQRTTSFTQLPPEIQEFIEEDIRRVEEFSKNIAAEKEKAK